MATLFPRARGLVRRYLFEGEVLKLMSLTIVSKPIGLATQMIMASSFGAGYLFDAYILSYFFVNFLCNIFYRVFYSVAIPFLTKIRGDMEEETLHGFINAILLIFLVPIIVFSLLAIVAPEAIINIGAPNAPPETKSLAVKMLQAMVVPAVLMLAVGLTKSVFNFSKAFRIPTALPIANSVITLVTLLLGRKALGIWALPVAFGISNLVQLVVVVGYGLHRRILVLAKPVLPPGLLGTLWKQSWMVLVATVILVMNLVVDKVFASGLAQGSVSSIAYSRAIETFGMQIFSFSLVTVMFTRSSELLADGNYQECNRYIEQNIHKLVRLAIPVCLALALASREVVYFLFQRNAFTAEDTVRTAGVLAIYMLGLPAYLANLVVANIFHSLGKFKDKIWLALQFILTNIVAAWTLIGPLEVMGLAIASSLAINVHLFLSFLFLHRYRLGIRADTYFWIIVKYYFFAGITWAVYSGLGNLGFLPGFEQGMSRMIVLLVGAVKFSVIFLIFGAIILLHKRLSHN